MLNTLLKSLRTKAACHTISIHHFSPPSLERCHGMRCTRYRTKKHDLRQQLFRFNVLELSRRRWACPVAIASANFKTWVRRFSRMRCTGIGSLYQKMPHLFAHLSQAPCCSNYSALEPEADHATEQRGAILRNSKQSGKE